MASTILFELPILLSPKGNPTGTIICTSPAPQVYLLTFTSPPDNRLVTSFCQTFLLALDIIEFSYPKGVVISTSSIAKFYSNGLDLDHAKSTKGFWSESLFALWQRLLTYPMPTIALINGHAFAGGLMLAMYHDYRIFNPSRGFLCLNELDFGMPLKPAMNTIFLQKTSPSVYRSLILEAKRFNAKEALEGGIVDGLGGMEEAMALIKERKLTEKGKSGVFGVMKAKLYRETVAALEGYDREEVRDEKNRQAEDNKKMEAQRRVKEWERNAKRGSAKL